jgi:hypothetical protein
MGVGIYRLFLICQRFESWDVLSTRDRIFGVWGAIYALVMITVLCSYGIMLKRGYLNRQ